MDNLTNTFSSVNDQVGQIATEVGKTPSNFMPAVFNMVRNLSESVIMPVAGILLTFIACYELIQLIISYNNLASFETWFIWKWIFKTFVAVELITHTFDITMAVFDVSQSVVRQAGGIIQGSTAVDASTLTTMQATLEAMELGPLLAIFLQSFIVQFLMYVLSAIIFVIINGRMVEIYLMVSLAPIPFATFGNKEQSMMGQNYMRSLFALGFQGFLIMVCVGIYAVLIQSVAVSYTHLVQAKMKGRKRQTEQGEYSMFAGLLRCAECGGALTLKKTHTKDQHEVYTCSTYIHKGKAHCTQHRVDADDLYDAVLTRIQECAKAVTGDGTELENRVKELCEEDTQGHRESLEKLVSKQKDRLETLDRLIAKLYDDLINDKITESVFDKMLEKTQKEQTDIKKELFQNESVLNTEEKLDAQSQQWIDDISEYADIKELDANLLNRLISKIVISEPQEKDGTENYCRTPETVTMEIHFNLKPIPELGTIERGSGSHK